MAWALHEATTTWRRPLLRASASPDGGGEQWVSERTLETLRAGAGQVVGGPSKRASPVCAAFSVSSTAADQASTVRLAGTARLCPTDGKGWRDEGVVGLGKAVSTRLWSLLPPKSPLEAAPARRWTLSWSPWPTRSARPFEITERHFLQREIPAPRTYPATRLYWSQGHGSPSLPLKVWHWQPRRRRAAGESPQR